MCENNHIQASKEAKFKYEMLSTFWDLFKIFFVEELWTFSKENKKKFIFAEEIRRLNKWKLHGFTRIFDNYVFREFRFRRPKFFHCNRSCGDFDEN
jgi:hypothetical protein